MATKKRRDEIPQEVLDAMKATLDREMKEYVAAVVENVKTYEKKKKGMRKEKGMKRSTRKRAKR